MTKPVRVVLVALLGVFSFAACGPASEDAGDEGVETLNPDEAVVGDEVPDDSGEVSQATFGGDLGSRLGNNLVSFNSCVANNEWRTTCGAGNSRDMSYTWTVPVTGDYVFSSATSTYDTVMEVRKAGATSEVLGCNDDPASGAHTQGRLVLRGLAKGRRLLIIIDGYGGECGTGYLHIVGL